VNIHGLVARKWDLIRELDSVNAEIYRIRVEATGIKEGDIVRHKKTGKIYKVCGFRHLEGGRPWLQGFIKLKDGSFGKLKRELYDDWEKVPQ